MHIEKKIIQPSKKKTKSSSNQHKTHDVLMVVVVVVVVWLIHFFLFVCWRYYTILFNIHAWYSLLLSMIIIDDDRKRSYIHSRIIMFIWNSVIIFVIIVTKYIDICAVCFSLFSFFFIVLVFNLSFCLRIIG